MPVTAVKRLSAELGLPVERVRLAADHYVTFPEEIDRLITVDEEAATAHGGIDQRGRLLSQ